MGEDLYIQQGCKTFTASAKGIPSTYVRPLWHRRKAFVRVYYSSGHWTLDSDMGLKVVEYNTTKFAQHCAQSPPTQA